jgi:LacI family transcriptional regulator
MNHLIASGRKNIVYFQGPYKKTIGPPRFQAYVDAMGEAGLETHTLTSPASTRVSAYEWLRAYVEDAGMPDALFCANDDFAIAALRVAKDMGVNVPDDMAIAGSDGLEETAYHYPGLTTIELPYTEMCRTAWKHMERRIAQPTAEPLQTIAKARLIMRDSTKS